MMEIFDVSYGLLSNSQSGELFSLRKKVFKDRLNWAVNCDNGMEYDEYDNIHATYLFGVQDEQIICSLRFIEIKYPNMINGVFKSYFNNIKVPEGNYLEASRLFIDKNRAKKMKLESYCISSMLFLAMINYTRHQGYEGIYAIISHPMLTIFKRSGWLVSVVEQGMSEKNTIIYLVYMPVDDRNQQILIHKVNQVLLIRNNSLNTWPLSL
ncbi:acyl-homoserine-lactone synthase [Yersinia rochesterensis]|uniref:acyl-homoserine-lactone synthase n=1 Tax=Yersinia rochesterensis TaxID=1604335 RepID=UPI0025AB1208|nr:acyl-homoserine-lactone synthase [Yersinia rochesterensis]MDN0107502.1 acyl-homoserine-lactone synthase [Yersinia rochesterensis]